MVANGGGVTLLANSGAPPVMIGGRCVYFVLTVGAMLNVLLTTAEYCMAKSMFGPGRPFLSMMPSLSMLTTEPLPLGGT